MMKGENYGRVFSSRDPVAVFRTQSKFERVQRCGFGRHYHGIGFGNYFLTYAFHFAYLAMSSAVG